MNISIEQTLRFMVDAHRTQKDKSGQPYWQHPCRVFLRLSRLETPVAHHAALLHDVIEDTTVTLGDLERMGYPPSVVSAVDLVSRYKEGRDKNRTYFEWISFIIESGNRDAILVKYADLLDNNSPSRLALLPSEYSSLEGRQLQALSMLLPVIPLSHLGLIVDGDVEIIESDVSRMFPGFVLPK